MEAFKEKTGINIARAIQAKQEEQAELNAAGAQEQQTAQRRVKQQEEEKPSTARRTTGSKYNVVSRAN
jgi:hypothetical protein